MSNAEKELSKFIVPMRRAAGGKFKIDQSQLIQDARFSRQKIYDLKMEAKQKDECIAKLIGDLGRLKYTAGCSSEASINAVISRMEENNEELKNLSKILKDASDFEDVMVAVECMFSGDSEGVPVAVPTIESFKKYMSKAAKKYAPVKGKKKS